MPGSIKTKFCNILVKKDFLFQNLNVQNIMSHDHTNDHNLDLTPFHTSFNNNALFSNNQGLQLSIFGISKISTPCLKEALITRPIK